jgi:succinate dehydrogenase flavin-adding protein (antitoxin of CptAB toxin-antitoxin module)
MTFEQFLFAFVFATFAAAILTPIQKYINTLLRKVTVSELEEYKKLLSRAQCDLEKMIALQKENQLVTKWGEGCSADYVRFCRDSLDNCSSAVKTVTSYLECNDHSLTKRAYTHLRKFSEGVKERITDMEEVIKLSSS